jgi:hypothetical protein
VYFSCVAVLRVRGTWRRCTYGTPGICSRVPTQLHRVIYFYCVFLTSVLLLLQAVQGSDRRAPNPPAEESGQGRAGQASTGPATKVSTAAEVKMGVLCGANIVVRAATYASPCSIRTVFPFALLALVVRRPNCVLFCVYFVCD